MTKSIFLSLAFHSTMIVLTALSLPFMLKAPIDLPPILSVDLIQITDKTSIPFAAKAAKTLEEIKTSSLEEVEIWLKNNGFKYHGLLMGKPRGGNYHWVDNHIVRATRFDGKFTELINKEVKIQVFKS